MHNQAGTHYNDLVGEVIESLAESVALATRAGVAQERVIVDPGIGFGKTWEQNLVLLRRLGELQRLGQPILVGTSRKSFIGKLLDGAPPADRLEGTAATVARSRSRSRFSCSPTAPVTSPTTTRTRSRRCAGSSSRRRS